MYVLATKRMQCARLPIPLRMHMQMNAHTCTRLYVHACAFDR